MVIISKFCMPFIFTFYMLYLLAKVRINRDLKFIDSILSMEPLRGDDYYRINCIPPHEYQ